MDPFVPIICYVVCMYQKSVTKWVHQSPQKPKKTILERIKLLQKIQKWHS